MSLDHYYLGEQICWTDLFLFFYVNRFYLCEYIFLTNFFLCEQIFFMWTNFFLLMFQIKPTKSIKPSRSNRTAIGRKTDPNWYASVLIITKPISIGSITNLKKYQANRTVHTPSSRVAAPTSDSSDTASGVQCVESPFFFFFNSLRFRRKQESKRFYSNRNNHQIRQIWLPK